MGVIIMNISFSPTAPSIVGTGPETDISIMITENPVTLLTAEFASADIVHNDVTYRDLANIGTKNNFQINVTNPSGGEFVMETPTPNILTISQSGAVSAINPGGGEVVIKSIGGERRLTRVMTGGYTTKVRMSYEQGSLGKHIVDSVSAMIIGKLAGDATQMPWISYGPDVNNPTGVRNPDLFTAAYDTTAIAAWQTHNGVHGDGNYSTAHPAVLITPRHIYGCNHWKPGTGAGPGVSGVGGKVAFKDAAGNYHIRTIVADWGTEAGGDVYVGLLDLPITTIEPMQVLPANWKSYMPSVSLDDLALDLPCVVKGQWTPAGIFKNWMHVSEFVKWYVDIIPPIDGVVIQSGFVIADPGTSYDASVPAHIDSFKGGQWGGESGSPQMFPINGKMTLLSTLYTPTGSTAISENLNIIKLHANSLAAAVGDNTPYSLRQADLSMFTRYTS